MNDLLKEAIADAKAVRKTALANAKLALEEAFTPKLQSMISAKIQEEAEYDDMDEMREDEMEDHNEMREDEHDMMDEMEDEMEEGGMREDEDEMREDEHEDVDEMREDEHEDVDEMREDEHEMREDEHEDEPVAEEDDLELEAIIKELEDEIEEDEHEELEEGHEDELEESNDASSGIGASDNKQPAPAANADSTDDPEGTGAKVVAESEDGMEGESETLDNLHEEEGDELEEGEDIDLEEVIRSLREEDEELEESEDGMEGESETINKLTEKLKESYSVVKFLRSKINEVNLLNAKLLFTNKLFRNGNLNEGQKLKVIETFDRAKSTREVKLVYTTLAESTMASRTSRKRKAIKEGFASKAVGSTKPRRAIISEGADMASRFKKLAGLTK